MGRAPSIVALVLAAVTSIACSNEPPPRPGVQPKHLLLVTVAGLRADHLSGPYLYLRPTSAYQIESAQRADGQALALDDVCELGVAFASAYAPSPNARESLIALHTGYPAVVSAGRDQFTTLAQDLSRAGFKCAAFATGTKLGDTQSLARGFASFSVKSSDAETLEAARQTLAADEWKNGAHDFVWIHLDGPEPPFDPSPLAPRQGEANGITDYASLFVDPKYAGAVNGSLEELGAIERGEKVLSREDRDHLVDLYDGEVAKTAAQLRSFLVYWRNLDGGAKLWDDTLFVFAGTNGVELYDRSQSKPRGGPWLGIERVRVPLVFRHPRSLTGSRLMAEPVDLCDVAPTIREWFLGFEKKPVTANGRGRSLLPVVDSYFKRPFESRDAFSIDVEHRTASLRTKDWSLLSSTPAGSKEPYLRLYDRLHDPLEEQDLGPQHPDLLRDLGAALQKRVEALKVP